MDPNSPQSQYLFDLPKAYGGTLDTIAQVKDSLMAFDITTGAE
jgi:hypothetical protein